jgi:NMD protein affecting ribosome stability and mRNA decay
MCFGCGYMMDAASGNDNAVPHDGDVSICLNCGRDYILREARWVVLSLQEKEKLPAYLRRVMLRRQQRLRFMKETLGMPDLTRRDHWT